MNRCTPNQCGHGGTCQTGAGGSVRCVCRTGFTGTRCDSSIGKSHSNALTHIDDAHGLATASPNTCTANPCVNGGSCQPMPGGGFRCVCRQGYVGLLCDFLPSEFQLDSSPAIHPASSPSYPHHYPRLFNQSVCQWWLLRGRGRPWRSMYLSRRVLRRTVHGKFLEHHL